MTAEAGNHIGQAAQAHVIACSASRCITARERRRALQLAPTRVSTELGRVRSSYYTELRSQISQFKILSVRRTTTRPRLAA